MALTQPNTPVEYLDSSLALLATGVYVVTRPAASTYVDGVEVPDPAPTLFQVEAVVNPLSGIDLQRLPEGRRSTDFREVFVSAALNTASDPNGADLIGIDGAQFEVNTSERWAAFGNFFRCVVERAARLNPS